MNYDNLSIEALWEIRKDKCSRCGFIYDKKDYKKPCKKCGGDKSMTPERLDL